MRGRKSPAPKRHALKVSGGTFARVLQRAERTHAHPDELADRLLVRMLDHLDATDERQAKEAQYRTAEQQAKAKSLPTVLRRDFGLPET